MSDSEERQSTIDQVDVDKSLKKAVHDGPVDASRLDTDTEHGAEAADGGEGRSGHPATDGPAS